MRFCFLRLCLISVTGHYYLLTPGEFEEILVQAAYTFFYTNFVDLKRVTHHPYPRPLVLFAVPTRDLEQIVRTFMTNNGMRKIYLYIWKCQSFCVFVCLVVCFCTATILNNYINQM